MYRPQSSHDDGLAPNHVLDQFVPPVCGCAPGLLLQDEFHGEAVPDLADRPCCTFHGLPPDVGRMLSAADKVFPQKVIQVLESGMLEYIPLNLLTDDACHQAAHEPPLLNLPS